MNKKDIIEGRIMQSDKINIALQFKNDSIIRSLSTGCYFIIGYNDLKGGWYKIPAGGFSTRFSNINYYKSLSTFVETELFFDFEITRE
jgi:hypothetical protein